MRHAITVYAQTIKLPHKVSHKAYCGRNTRHKGIVFPGKNPFLAKMQKNNELSTTPPNSFFNRLGKNRISTSSVFLLEQNTRCTLNTVRRVRRGFSPFLRSVRTFLSDYAFSQFIILFKSLPATGSFLHFVPTSSDVANTRPLPAPHSSAVML